MREDLLSLRKMVKTHIAADSKLFRFGEFRAPLGTCVTISNFDDFKEKYDETIESIITKEVSDPKLNVYKSYNFAEIFKDELVEALEEFLLKISEVDGIEFVSLFSTFNTQKLPTVTLYPDDPERVKTIKFLEKYLTNYYSYISAWKVSKNWKLRYCDVLLDNFRGIRTKAWDELAHHHDVNVVFRGDNCNRLISTADLITRYMDEKIKKDRLRLDEENLEKIYSDLESERENFSCYYVGQEDFECIVPNSRREIELEKYYIKPTVFVLKERLLKKEKNWIENSPIYWKLLNFSNYKGAGLKFIDYLEDPDLLRKGDFLIYIGKEGEEQAKYISETLGYPITAKSIKDI